MIAVGGAPRWSAPTMSREQRSTRCVLEAFLHTVASWGTGRALFELMIHSASAVFAHRDRNETLMAEVERFYNIAEMWVLCQMNADSIDGQFVKRLLIAARIMLGFGAGLVRG